MPMTFARLLDPSFEDDKRSLCHYDARGETLENRLYLPCGIDPHKKVCQAAFVHLLPQRQEILSQRSIPNQYLQAALWLVQEGQRLADQSEATPSMSSKPPAPTSDPKERYVNQLPYDGAK